MKTHDMTPFITGSQELADMLAEEARMVDLIRPYIRDRKEEAGSKSKKEASGAKLKAYLEANPGKVLRDDFGNTAEIRDVKSSANGDRFDVASMPDELILKLARAKALDVDREMLRALDGKDMVAIDAKRYLIPGGTTTRLNVEEAK